MNCSCGKKYSMHKDGTGSRGGIGGLMFIDKYIPASNRMGALVELLFTNPENIKDESIVMRVNAITYSFQSFMRIISCRME